jgi:hypothetical protein
MGPSSSGKSSKLYATGCKELARYERVFYNLLEEETDDSVYRTSRTLNQMNDVKDNFGRQV